MALLINCICTPSIFACPHCGFIINRDIIAASSIFLGLVYVLSFYGIKIILSKSVVDISKFKDCLLGMAFICGSVLFYWLQIRAMEVYEFDRKIEFSIHCSWLSDLFEVIIVAVITLVALFFRVYRSKSRFEHFVYNIIGFAMPIAWLLMLIRYASERIWDVGLILLGLWFTMALISINIKLFSIVCFVLIYGILQSFLISDSFDTLSFIIITLILIASLAASGEVTRRRYKPKNEAKSS